MRPFYPLATEMCLLNRRGKKMITTQSFRNAHRMASANKIIIERGGFIPPLTLLSRWLCGAYFPCSTCITVLVNQVSECFRAKPGASKCHPSFDIAIMAFAILPSCSLPHSWAGWWLTRKVALNSLRPIQSRIFSNWCVRVARALTRLHLRELTNRLPRTH
jgi:hypothetical protein